MVELQPGWELKGIYNEACASEGHCPYYFGRDKEGGCRFFMTFRIKQGEVNGVDLAGITAIYMGDLPHATFAEVLEKGSEGAIYISDQATPEQREIMDTLAVQYLGGGRMMQRVLGIQYVTIDIDESDDYIHIKMPTGELKMQLTKSHDGKPVGISNPTIPFLSNVKTAHTEFWNWSDYDKSFDYKNKCGTWADFTMTPEPH